MRALEVRKRRLRCLVGGLRSLTLIVFLPLAGCDRGKKVGEFSSSGNEVKNERVTKAPRSAGDHGQIESIFTPDNGFDPHSQSEYLKMEKRISAVSRESLERILERCGDDRHTSPNSAIFTLAISELARRDPEAAMSWFPGARMTPNEPGFMQVAVILAKGSPQVLQNWLRDNLTKCNPEARADIFVTSIAAMGREDARSAFSFLSNINSGGVSNADVIDALFMRFGRQAPFEAEQAAAGKYTGSDLDRARYNISIGAVDPDKKFEIAGNIRDGSLRGDAMSGALLKWLDTSRPEAMAKISELTPKELQGVLQSQVFDSGSLVNKLGRLDPEFLCGLLNQLTFSKSSEAIFNAALDRLSQEAPEKAERLLASLPAGEAKNQMIGSRIAVLARQSASSAVESASKLMDPSARQAAYRSIGGEIGGGGADGIVAAAEGLPEADRKSLLSTALPRLVMEKPDEAVGLIDQNKTLLGSVEKQHLYGLLGEKLGRNDTSGALQWMAHLGEDEQPAAMRGIATEMARVDIQGLGKLLTSMPQDRTWEAGVRVLVGNLKDSDPELAQQWKDALIARGYK